MYKIDNLTMEDVMFIDYCIFRYKQRLENEIIETKMYINKATKENDADSYKIYSHMLETKQASIIKCDQLSHVLENVKSKDVENV